jgi:preprotein translocase subunit SecG
MLSDKQSLILCGLMAGGIFIFGILDILNNFVVLTILTLIFFTIIINLFYVKSKHEKDTKKQDQSK